MPLLPRACTFAAYFLGGISAGRYREISKPAATWHMVGFVQLFFMAFLLFYQPEGADPFLKSTIAGAPLQWLVVHQVSNGQMKRQVLKNRKTKPSKITMFMLQLLIT